MAEAHGLAGPVAHPKGTFKFPTRCCDHAGLDFTDAAVREAYVEARRRPDLASVRAQLAEHYRRFWSRP